MTGLSAGVSEKLMLSGVDPAEVATSRPDGAS